MEVRADAGTEVSASSDMRPTGETISETGRVGRTLGCEILARGRSPPNDALSTGALCVNVYTGCGSFGSGGGVRGDCGKAGLSSPVFRLHGQTDRRPAEVYPYPNFSKCLFAVGDWISCTRRFLLLHIHQASSSKSATSMSAPMTPPAIALVLLDLWFALCGDFEGDVEELREIEVGLAEEIDVADGVVVPFFVEDER